MTTATAPAAPREIYEAARERLEARRNVYRTYTEAEELRARLEGRTLPRTGLYEPDYRQPSSIGEFFDDRVIEWGGLLGDPAVPVLFAIAAAAREGQAAAVRAVKAARGLDAEAQWVVFQNLTAWRQEATAVTTGAAGVVGAVLAEWARAGFADERPDLFRHRQAQRKAAAR